MSVVRNTPESPPPEEKFPHGMIRVIPPESFGDGARDPRKISHKKFPLFEGLIPDRLAEAHRAWKRQKLISKPMKRWAASDSKGSKKFPGPRLDPDVDPKDPLVLSR